MADYRVQNTFVLLLRSLGCRVIPNFSFTSNGISNIFTQVLQQFVIRAYILYVRVRVWCVWRERKPRISERASLDRQYWRAFIEHIYNIAVI